MDTKVRDTSEVFDEFAKFAHEAIDDLHGRAVKMAKSMTKAMDEGKSPFAMTFGEGSKLGNYFETNPTKEALFAFMIGVWFNQMMKSRGVKLSVATGPETMKTGGTSKPKMTAKTKKAA